MINEIQNLLDQYLAQLMDKTALRQVKDWIEITTPYLDRHNDYLQIYVKRENSGYILWSKRKREMDEAESVALVIATDKLLRMYDADRRFTAEDIKMMHKIWLGEIYDWAGEYRQVNVSKGDFPFAAAKHIPQLITA